MWEQVRACNTVLFILITKKCKFLFGIRESKIKRVNEHTPGYLEKCNESYLMKHPVSYITLSMRWALSGKIDSKKTKKKTKQFGRNYLIFTLFFWVAKWLWCWWHLRQSDCVDITLWFWTHILRQYQRNI